MRKFVLIFVALALFLSAASPAAASTTLHVHYAGPEGSSVRTALTLAECVELVDDPAQADVLVLNGTIPDPAALAPQVQGDTGLVLILGPGVTAGAVETLLGAPVTLEPRDEPLSLTAAEDADDMLVQEIAWNSAPQVRERMVVEVAHTPPFRPLVVGYEVGLENDEAVLQVGRLGTGAAASTQAFVFTPFLDGSNPQIQDWAYFNYLIYALTLRAAGRTPLPFADYPGSPVPHAAERTVFYIILAGILALAGGAFILVRRYSLAHPEELDRIVASREDFDTRQKGTDWDEVGFHRPLGGFLLTFFAGLFMFVPLIIYQIVIRPVYILPSAQALGIWNRVVQFFEFLWLLFDMGTSAAFIKYMSQYRTHDPRRGIQYGQVFVWWQTLSGAVQVALFVGLAGTVLPRTAYALYTWALIAHVIIQIPGFYRVARHVLLGMQRHDYAQAIEVTSRLLFPMLTQPVFVLIMLAWGQSQPVFGLAMSGVIGLGLAAYAAEVLVLVLGLWLYRRLGYNSRVLFLAHFDWAIVKEAFRFGVFEMLGSVAWAIGQAVEILITQARLVNYTEEWGNWSLAQDFVFAYYAIFMFCNSLMPSISEAISNARKALSQYYAAMAYKWGGLISVFTGASMLAIADRLILGATGPEFERAALYVVPLTIWGAMQFPSWAGDTIQLAANRPYLKTLMVVLEQVVRIALVFFLMARFQINALILAFIVGIMVKNVVTYLVNNRACFRQRFYAWQSLVGPLLAGVAHYLVLRPLTGLIWSGDEVTSVVIFFIGTLPSYPLFAFFTGLFGAWDDASLDELRRAVELSGFARPFAWLFWKAAALGARISPLHNRFPVDIRDAALAEARTLTEERVQL